MRRDYSFDITPVVLIVMLFAVIMMGLSSCDDIDINDKDQYDTAVIYVGGEWINV